MNRTTIFALLAFVVLLGVVLVFQTLPSEPDDPQLRIEGWKAAAEKATEEAAEAGADEAAEDEAGDDAAAEDDPAMDAGAPKPPKEVFSDIDRVEITRGGETVVIEQVGDDKKKWRIREPLEANADWFRLRPILERFAEPLASSVSKTVQPDDLRLFQLDEAHGIRLKLFEDGKVFADIVVGGTETSELPGAGGPTGGPGAEATDTWVMTPGEEGRAYRLPGVDLRTPIDKELSDLRSKKVFDREKEAVERVIVENPDDERYPRVVLVREDGDGDGDGGWRIETPKGFRAGSVDAFVSSVLGLYASDYLAADDAEGAAALGDDAARITLETADGSLVLHVSEPGESHGYVRVEGRDEIVKVSQFTAKNLRKTLSDLRDKSIFDLAAEDITAVRLTSEKGQVAVRRDGGAWVAETPAGLEVGAKQMGTLTRDIAGFRVLEWKGSVPPAETGLDDPSRRLAVQAGGTTHILLLGDEAQGEGNKVWGTLEGSPEVFLVSSYVAKKLDKGPADLEDRSVFRVGRDAITAVALHHPGGEIVSLQREGGAGGGWHLAAEGGPAALKKGPVAAIVSSLASLEAKDRKPAAAPAEVGLGDGAFRVVVTTADGATRTLWLGDDADGGAVHARTDAPHLAGEVFTITSAQAKGLKKTAADLKDDGTTPRAPHVHEH